MQGDPEQFLYDLWLHGACTLLCYYCPAESHQPIAFANIIEGNRNLTRRSPYPTESYTPYIFYLRKIYNTTEACLKIVRTWWL